MRNVVKVYAGTAQNEQETIQISGEAGSRMMPWVVYCTNFNIKSMVISSEGAKVVVSEDIGVG